MTGDDHSISFEPIILTIEKHTPQELTIIDLPGMTRVMKKDSSSDKPIDIEQDIKNLYKEYMNPKETIIINVSNIMVDLDTSASLQLS